MFFSSSSSSFFTLLGKVDPPGAQEKVLEIASNLGLSITVAVALEVALENSGISCNIHEMCLVNLISI